VLYAVCFKNEKFVLYAFYLYLPELCDKDILRSQCIKTIALSLCVKWLVSSVSLHSALDILFVYLYVYVCKFSDFLRLMWEYVHIWMVWMDDQFWKCILTLYFIRLLVNMCIRIKMLDFYFFISLNNIVCTNSICSLNGDFYDSSQLKPKVLLKAKQYSSVSK